MAEAPKQPTTKVPPVPSVRTTPMDISKMPLNDLKALAYDQRQQLDNIQANLKTLNTQIIMRMRAKPNVPVANAPATTDPKVK